jgi:type II secretory pathway pseudopilin PulG
MMKNAGFSLVESLLSLLFFSMISLFCLEFFGFSRDIFLKIKASQEAKFAAHSAIDKLKIDLSQGGLGLGEPIALGILEAIQEDGGVLTIASAEKSADLQENVASGETTIPLENAEGFKKGREICIYCSFQGEVKAIQSVQENIIQISSPLTYPYKKETAQAVLLHKISIFFDAGKQMLRRKANSSSPQPLLEEVSAAEWSIDGARSLVMLELFLTTEPEKKYETSLLAKNSAFHAAR